MCLTTTTMVYENDFSSLIVFTMVKCMRQFERRSAKKLLKVKMGHINEMSGTKNIVPLD